MILGVVVTSTSIINKKMRFFIFIGVLFFLYGTYGAILSFIRRVRRKKVAKLATEKTIKSNRRLIIKNKIKAKREGNNTHANPHNHPHNLKKCPNCGAIVSKTFRFCPYCGYGV